MADRSDASKFVIPQRYTDGAFQKIQTFRTELESKPTQVPWFQHILTSLLDAVIREYPSLVLGLKESTPLLAWSCRNMLELDIYTKFVLLKQSNAKQFAEDIWIDGFEMFSAFKGMTKFYEPDTPITALEKTIENFRIQKEKRQITRSYLRSNELAVTVGLGEAFQHMNKIASKLVHPTAFSVLTEFDKGELAHLKPILFNYGAQCGVEAHNDIREYVSKNGVEPASG